MNKNSKTNQYETIYDEIQRIPSPWFIISLSLTVIILGYFIYGEYALGKIGFYDSISLEMKGFVLLSTVLLTINILFSHLRIIIRKSGLTVYYWPFVNREIRFDDIIDFDIIRYKPSSDLGICGIASMRDAEMTYNVKGKQGIRLYLRNGHTIIIGSQMVSEMREVVESRITRNKGTDLFNLGGKALIV